MKKISFVKLALLVAPLLTIQATDTQTLFAHDSVLHLSEGDHICLVGNGLGERTQHFNYWETDLYARHAKKNLVVRNLCFSADEPQFRPRSQNFGEPDQHLKHSQASVILYFFGFNESFKGEAGIELFKQNLTDTVSLTLKQDYGKGKPKVVWFLRLRPNRRTRPCC